MGNFQRVRSGQHLKLNETTLNAMIGAGEDWAKHFRDPGSSASPEYFFEGNVIQVKNDSGYDMPRFGVAGLSSPLITPTQNLAEFQNYPRFSVRVPILPDDSKKFCVLVEPIADGKIGQAMVSGVVPCQIWRVPGDALPLYADVKASTISYLQSSGAGAGVLWCDAAPGSAGPVWALVRISESSARIIPFELKTDLTPGSYATAYPMKADESDADTSATTFTIYDQPEGNRRAFGRDTTGTSSGQHGARGHAIHDSGSGHWQIVAIQEQAQKIKVSISSTGIAPGATFSSTALDVMDPKWQDPSFGTGVLANIQNGSTPIMAGATGVIALWDEGLAKYLVIGSGGPALRAFKLTQDTWPDCIDSGGVAATTSASVVWEDDYSTGTVYLYRASSFTACMQFGVGRGSNSRPMTYTTGLAQYDPIAAKWFVVSGDFSCFAAGVTYGAISNNAIGLVHVYWTNLATGSTTLVDSGADVKALNWIPNANIADGYRVALQYIPGERRWYILAPGSNPC